MKHTVSVAELMKMSVCPSQVKTFAKHFGHGDVTVTRERLQKAAKLELDVAFWFRHTFPSLDAAYWAQRKPLYDAYRAQRKPLYDAYRAQKSLDDAYWAQVKSLDDAYWAQVKSLDDAYRAQVATLIADLLELP